MSLETGASVASELGAMVSTEPVLAGPGLAVAPTGAAVTAGVGVRLANQTQRHTMPATTATIKGTSIFRAPFPSS
jgi:hypothetical protein